MYVKQIGKINLNDSFGVRQGDDEYILQLLKDDPAQRIFLKYWFSDGKIRQAIWLPDNNKICTVSPEVLQLNRIDLSAWIKSFN